MIMGFLCRFAPRSSRAALLIRTLFLRENCTASDSRPKDMRTGDRPGDKASTASLPPVGNTAPEGKGLKLGSQWVVTYRKQLAEREGLTSAAFVLPSIMANFCFNCQRYQSLATERSCIFQYRWENK